MELLSSLKTLENWILKKKKKKKILARLNLVKIYLSHIYQALAKCQELIVLYVAMRDSDE